MDNSLLFVTYNNMIVRGTMSILNNENKHIFTNGYCSIFAYIVNRRTDLPIYGYYTDNGRIDHAFLKYNDVYYDAYGELDMKECESVYTNKLVKLEHVDVCRETLFLVESFPYAMGLAESIIQPWLDEFSINVECVKKDI